MLIAGGDCRHNARPARSIEQTKGVRCLACYPCGEWRPAPSRLPSSPRTVPPPLPTWAPMRAAWPLPLTFPAVMALGAVAGMSGVALPAVESALAATVLVLGLVIALALRPSV